ncbi:uncharacterized protein LOC119067144 [Bradysia coprophila]|uniref:uncharacterized protein LOC119067144 n=1 Tax=Bradysia coprophila TaxID=38358 RepID=UPI00187DB90F|nr:uncharacterized protein LOC119067144 [Bradysia coprophila]
MTQNSLTKMKRRWIDKYRSEFDAKVLKSAEMLKLIVKPKSIWFVQHLLSEGSSSSTECNNFEGDEIRPNADREHDKLTQNAETNEMWSDNVREPEQPTVNNYGETDEIWSDDDGGPNIYEETNGTHQKRLVCDKGYFGSFCDNRGTVTNSVHIRNGPSWDRVHALVNGHSGKVQNNHGTKTNSPKICYENSTHSYGNFYEYTPPRYGRHNHKESIDYGNNRRPHNGHGFRGAPDRHNSPKPYASSKYNRNANGFNKFYHRKPLLESRWNSRNSPY